MKFMVVSDRAPRISTVCTCCTKPIESGYLRELSSNALYCDYACYLRRKMVLVSWSFEGLESLAVASLQLAEQFQWTILKTYTN